MMGENVHLYNCCGPMTGVCHIPEEQLLGRNEYERRSQVQLHIGILAIFKTMAEMCDVFWGFFLAKQ